MLILLDACTLINLVNGEVLAQALSLPDYHFSISNSVREEVWSAADAVDQAVESGKLGIIDDSEIQAAAYARAKREMALGDGETECIVAADQMDCYVACDDRLARRAAKAKLGKDRVLGSIGLLRKLCAAGVLTTDEAFAAYTRMRKMGAFLPDLNHEVLAIAQS